MSFGEPVPVNAKKLREFLESHGIQEQVVEVIVEFSPPELEHPDLIKKLPNLRKIKNVKVRIYTDNSTPPSIYNLQKHYTPTMLFEELFIHYSQFVTIVGSACDLPIMLFKQIDKLLQDLDPKMVVYEWFKFINRRGSLFLVFRSIFHR